MRGDGLQKGWWEEGILLKQKAAQEEKWGWQGEGGIGRGIQGKMNCVLLHPQTREDYSEQELYALRKSINATQLFKIALLVIVQTCVRTTDTSTSIWCHSFFPFPY